MADFYDPDNDDGRGYEDKPSKSKSWWWREHDYDHRDYSYSKGSGSRSWMSKIGGGTDWWRPKKDTNEVYQDLINQLQNSANIIGGNERGKVAVHWSNGNDVNDIRSDRDGCHHIYLSPDNLLSSSGSDREVSEEVLDAMTGKVYLASTLRETVDPKAYAKAKAARMKILGSKFANDRYPCPCNSGIPFVGCCKGKIDGDVKVLTNAIALWESIETSIARTRILEDWKGFGPYIASDAARSSATKEKVQEFIDASVAKPSVDAATAAIAWNLLNSSDPVSIPDCYDKCIEAAAEMMDEEIAAKGRFDACNELVETIRKILKTIENGPPSEGDDEDSKSKGDGGSEGSEGEDSDEGDEDSNSDDEGDDEDSDDDDYEDDEDSDSDEDGDGDGDESDEPPELCDSSLLGGKVSNSTNTELSEQKASDESSDSENADISVKPPEGICTLGEKFEMVNVKIQPRFAGEYRTIVTEHRSEIGSIRSSMMFRNSVSKMVSYGHRSGDIDENSLFKLRMNDDRVMTKTDSVSSKSIAICLLVDESGSMGASSSEGTRATAARNVAIVIAESLRGIDGISVSIYGHSAEEKHGQGVTLREYYSPRQTNLAACMEIQPRRQNHDSYAIMHTATIFNRDCFAYDRKIFFVISDGEPGGSGYGGAPARKHMLDVSNACLKKGVEVYGIGVANAFSTSIGASMYGDGRFVILNDVRGSLGVMSRFIRQIAMR